VLDMTGEVDDRALRRVQLRGHRSEDGFVSGHDGGIAFARLERVPR
jgi:hypothetical protein